MRIQFTNDNVVNAVKSILERGVLGHTDVNDMICGLVYAGAILKEELMEQMNILTQSAFEVSYRFDGILKTIITTWERDENEDFYDIEKAKKYILETAVEVSKLIKWTDTSEVMAMDYILSKAS